jgi:tetratricopeptide (TPR) repeat protein
MSVKSRRQQIEEMLLDSPNDPFLLYGLAMEWSSAGEDESALRTFSSLLQLDADYVPAYLQAGQLLARRDRTDEARKMFQRGIEAARRTGNEHALGEMQGFLDGLD